MNSSAISRRSCEGRRGGRGRVGAGEQGRRDGEDEDVRERVTGSDERKRE